VVRQSEPATAESEEAHKERRRVSGFAKKNREVKWKERSRRRLGGRKGAVLESSDVWWSTGGRGVKWTTSAWPIHEQRERPPLSTIIMMAICLPRRVSRLAGGWSCPSSRSDA